MIEYEDLKNALAHVQKPCAFLHLEALNANINAIKNNAGDKKIRVASKSIRSLPVLKYIFEQSDVFQGIMCFTADEAMYLYEEGLDDLLIAYPLWDKGQLMALGDLMSKGANITIMIDSVAHIEHLLEIAQADKLIFNVCLDIDMSKDFGPLHFGVYRSPVRNMSDVIGVLEVLKKVKDKIRLVGVMGYEAQIAGVTDRDPNARMRGLLVRQLKARSVKIIRDFRAKVIRAIEEFGFELQFVNGGGTGSLHLTREEAAVTEVTVGSGFFNSHLFDKYADFKYAPAVGFACEIVRIPEADIYTCLGGGYVASGPTAQDKQPEIFLPEGAAFIATEGVGEVQTPIKYKGPIPLNHGDPIVFRHSKAGELCERFSELIVIENKQVKTTFSTYRGDGKCFL